MQWQIYHIKLLLIFQEQVFHSELLLSAKTICGAALWYKRKPANTHPAFINVEGKSYNWPLKTRTCCLNADFTKIICAAFERDATECFRMSG